MYYEGQEKRQLENVLADALDQFRKNPQSSHEFHIWVAWKILINMSFSEALEFGAHFYRTNQRPNAKIGYHATITHSYMRLIYQGIKRMPISTFEEFKVNNVKLFDGNFQALRDFYSDQRLWSKEAKMNFIDGDLSLLPICEL